MSLVRYSRWGPILDSYDKKSILIFRPGALGDTLMLLPSICRLRARYRIELAGRRPGIELVGPHVAKCFDMDAATWHRLFMPNCVPGDLPAKDPDFVISFMGDPDGIIFRNLRACYPDASVFSFPSLPQCGARQHVAQYVAQCLQRSGIELDVLTVLRNAIQRALLERKDNHKRRYLVLHPGSGSRTKNYSTEFWLSALKQVGDLGKNTGLSTVVLLGPAERHLAPEFSEQRRRFGFQILKEPSMPDLLRLMNNTKVFIGHDSGVSHVAAMAGAGTVALFKASDPILWRPLGPRVAIIERVYEEETLLAQVLECIEKWI